MTDDTLAMVRWPGGLTEETLEAVRRLGATPELGYREYRIRPTPKQVRGTGEWTLEVHIARDRGAELRDRLCNARDTFKSRDEAVAWSIQFARDIIDGKVEGCSVADL